MAIARVFNKRNKAGGHQISVNDSYKKKIVQKPCKFFERTIATVCPGNKIVANTGMTTRQLL